MTLNIALKHYTRHAAQVAEISQSVENVGILGVVFIRLFADGSLINLASRPSWTDFYYRTLYSGGYQKKDIVDTFNVQEGISLWTLNPDNKAWQDLSTHFGLGNGITLTENKQDYQELMLFYSTADNHAINNFYINNLDLLKRFKNNFIIKAEALIKQAERVKDTFTHHPLLVSDTPVQATTNILQFDWTVIFNLTCSELDNLLVKRSYPVHYDTIHTTVSKMEIHTIIQLLKGKHAGEIANSLGIKQSTVESYLSNVKNKLGVNRKSELVNTIIDKQILQQIILGTT